MGKKRHFIIWLPTPNNMLRDVFEAFFNAWKFAYKYMQVCRHVSFIQVSVCKVQGSHSYLRGVIVTPESGPIKVCKDRGIYAVSYTHLTLPTIYSV